MKRWVTSMTTRSFCRECDGTGWIVYRSETLDGGFEEAYRLCPSCYAPRRCMASETEHSSCHRPGTVRYGLSYYCKEHIEVIHAGRDVNNAQAVIHGLLGPAASGLVLPP